MGGRGADSGISGGKTKALRNNLNAVLRPQIGEYKNEDTGIVAHLSQGSIDKLGSGKAIEKSKNNGFSVSQHFEVAEDITGLYERSKLVSSSPSTKKNDTSTVSIKRFIAEKPLRSGMKANAYITVKETIQSGHRIYSVELLDLKKK